MGDTMGEASTLYPNLFLASSCACIGGVFYQIMMTLELYSDADQGQEWLQDGSGQLGPQRTL